MGGLVGRLYYLQVVERERFRLLAEENRLNVQLLAPSRGRIYDRNGVELAANRNSYRVLVVPEQTRNMEETLGLLGELVRLSPDDKIRTQEQLRRVRPFVPIEIRKDLSWEEVSRVEVNALSLPGVQIDTGETRIYPLGFLAAHVTGYVGAVSPSELESNRLYSLPSFRIGKNGLEKSYEEALRGTGGTRHVEINAGGRVIKEVRREPPKPGRDLWSSLDVPLQRSVYRHLRAERRAAATVMNIHTGEVLALASVPAYDPNPLVTGIDPVLWQSLRTHPDHPLSNKAVSGVYAPGSTFKIAVLACALEKGVPLSHAERCTGSMYFSNRRFHCWRPGGHGRPAMLEAFRESCDVWYYRIGEQLGIENIASMARLLGLGAAPGVELREAHSGLVPDKEWKRSTLGTGWFTGETLLAAIGQSYCLVTPMQLAVMTARVVNGGYAVRPTLLRQGTRPVQFPSLGLRSETLDTLRRGMEQVVNHKDGTAWPARIETESMRFAGKTGTAQVQSFTEEERRRGAHLNENLDWVERDNSLFAGFAPLDSPQWSFSVVVEHGGSGLKASFIARNIAQDLQKRFIMQKPSA